ncbi:MAG: choice-of-anchor Q domain-containing protein [Solirubrobacteraceae bacterium]
MKLVRLALLSGVLAIGVVVLGAAAAIADTYTVASTADESNTPCPDATAACSLRQLILYVEAHPFPPDTIEVPAGTYTLNPSFGALVIDDSMSIVGAGANDTVIQQPVPSNREASGDHVFYVSAPAEGFTPTVTISGVEVAGGDANGKSSYGPLPVSAYFGGDLFNAGALTLSEDWVTSGFACSGAGVANYEGSLTIERSLISANHSACGGGDSGGIENFGCPTSGSSTVPDCSVNLPGHLVLDNSTVADNDARLVGGIFSWNDASNTVTISNSTIAGNANQEESGQPARGLGAGLGLEAGAARVENSIIAGNVEITGGSTIPTNCRPTPGLTSLGRNIDSGTDCGLSDTIPGQADQSDTNPLLGPLQSNGGPTMTMALAPGSPALDKVPASGADCPSTDQRGVLRPQGSGCDIGAFELQVPPVCDSVAAQTATGGSTVTVALSCGGTAPGPLTYAVLSNPAHGTLSNFSSSGGVVEYTPTDGFTGTDTFTYDAVSSGGTGNTAIVTVEIPPAPPSPPPTLTSVGLTNRYFRVARQATAVLAKQTPLGTSFRFTLSAAAKLQIAITATVGGLRRGHACLAPTTKLERAHAKRCARTVSLGGLTRASEPQGADSVPFSGRIGDRALSPGAYSATLSASNTNGQSKPVALSFTVVH